MSHEQQAKVGLAYGLAAYLAWGFIPVYFKQVSAFPAFEVLGHRIVWSVAFVAIALALQRKWGEAAACARSGRTLLWLLGSTTMIAINWLVFIWAVAKGYVLEASLGYFINPLVNVLLGFVFLRERLRTWQIAGVILATIGVANLTLHQGQLPWIALTLAMSFGIYGLLRKTAHVGPVVGLAIETSLLLPLGLYLAAVGTRLDLLGGRGLGWSDYQWLPLSGVVTAVPLLWFAAAAKRLRLSTLGFLQYVAPTCHFLLAVFAYGERFTPTHLLSFCCIWLALVIYSFDSLRMYWTTRERQLPGPVAAQRTS